MVHGFEGGSNDFARFAGYTLGLDCFGHVHEDAVSCRQAALTVTTPDALRENVAQATVGADYTSLGSGGLLDVVARRSDRQGSTRRRRVIWVVAVEMLVEIEDPRRGQRAPEDAGDADAPRDCPSGYIEVKMAEARGDLGHRAGIGKVRSHARYIRAGHRLRIDP